MSAIGGLRYRVDMALLGVDEQVTALADRLGLDEARTT